LRTKEVEEPRVVGGSIASPMREEGWSNPKQSKDIRHETIAT
jgi:hypothetical protein